MFMADSYWPTADAQFSPKLTFKSVLQCYLHRIVNNHSSHTVASYESH